MLANMNYVQDISIKIQLINLSIVSFDVFLND